MCACVQATALQRETCGNNSPAEICHATMTCFLLVFLLAWVMCALIEEQLPLSLVTIPLKLLGTEAAVLVINVHTLHLNLDENSQQSIILTKK